MAQGNVVYQVIVDGNVLNEHKDAPTAAAAFKAACSAGFTQGAKLVKIQVLGEATNGVSMIKSFRPVTGQKRKKKEPVGA